MPTDTYPLANLRGIGLFMRILGADNLWRKATPRQRQILTETAAPVVDGIKAAIKAGDDHGAWDRPVVHAHRRTRESLREKGFTDDENRLTAAAIEAAMFKLDKPSVVDVELPEEESDDA